MDRAAAVLSLVAGRVCQLSRWGGLPAYRQPQTPGDEHNAEDTAGLSAAEISGVEGKPKRHPAI